jgi:hypothetical protein
MPTELLRRFAVYRGVVTAAALGQWLVLRVTRPSRWSFVHGYVFSALVSGMIVKMTVDLGGFDTPYYAGLMLVSFPVNVMLPWRAVHSAINGLVTVAMYVAANLVWGGPFSPQALINNLYFLVSTVVVAVAMSHTRYRLIHREFYLRADLEDLNASLARSRAELRAARDRLWSEM